MLSISIYIPSTSALEAVGTSLYQDSLLFSIRLDYCLCMLSILFILLNLVSSQVLVDSYSERKQLQQGFGLFISFAGAKATTTLMVHVQYQES